MIELKVIQNQSIRSVMNKFRTLIEEGRIVLVGFNDKKVGIG